MFFINCANSRPLEFVPYGQFENARIHDLRHSFAVAALLSWHRSGADVQAMLPRLSAYPGHADPRHTYAYLSAAPELLALAAGRLQASQEEQAR